MDKINHDDMNLEELIEYYKDKRFFMYDCNCPQWNRALLKIREKYGDVRPNPKTGFGVIHKGE